MATTEDEDRTTTFEVRDAPETSRYELVEDGVVVGHAAYRADGDRLVVPHVEVDPSRRGHGLAARLMADVADDVRRRGLRIRPVCPYAAAWFRRHPEAADVEA
jgi:predicted GNAT family acetyltransferase